MLESLPTGLLLRLMNATPEQLAAVERVLGGVRDEKLKTETLKAGMETVRRDCFERCGDHWKVVFRGKEMHLLDSLGARYIEHLIRRPNQPIAAFDLEVAVTPEKGEARHRGAREKNASGEAVRRYLRELSQLRAEREEATGDCDEAAALRIDAEIEAIETALRNGKGSSDAGERARNNVRKAINAVVRSLEAGDSNQKAFAEHLRQFLDTGYECVYRAG